MSSDPINGREVAQSRTTTMPPSPTRGLSKAMTKTQGELEAAICDGITKFEQEFMGRGPKDIRAHLIGDLLVIRIQGALSSAERHLVASFPVDKGRDLLKQVRVQLMETARPLLEEMVQSVMGVKVVSLHHDVSTLTGEKMVILTLAGRPLVRDTKRK